MSRISLGFILLAMVILIGCSGSGNGENPVIPSAEDRSVASDSHGCWGLWQFTTDPVSENIEAIPLRAGSTHLNALPFLEPPALVHLTVDSVTFNGNLINIGIGLRHPYPGDIKFTGFDVCGILIVSGSMSGFNDSGIVMVGQDDVRLTNADGYSRWWNPNEFPVNDGSAFGYTDGLLGTENETAHFNTTLNGYKYYCYGLGPDDSLDVIDLAGRGHFLSGQKIVRKFSIDHKSGEPLVFNYAVDACWAWPTGNPPYDIPESFSEEANRAEAWRIKVDEVINTLSYDGLGPDGELQLDIHVYDWFNNELNTITVESPDNFDTIITTTPSGGGEGYSTYTIDITDTTHTGPGGLDILISVISEEAGFQGFIPGTNTAAYYVHTAVVPGLKVISPNGGENWDIGSSEEIQWSTSGTSTTSVRIEYSKDDFDNDLHLISGSTANDGSFTISPVPNDPTFTGRVRISDIDNPSVYDISDGYFMIGMENAIYVDDSNDSGYEIGTMESPYNTIQEGLIGAEEGEFVLVDDSGEDYIGPVDLKEGVVLASMNWDSTDGGTMASIYTPGTEVINGAKDATIMGFKIHGARTYGVRVAAAACTIKDCLITNISNEDEEAFIFGIYALGSPGMVVDGCEITEIVKGAGFGEAYGVYFSNTPGTIKNNRIHDIYSNFDNLQQAGIYAIDSSPSQDFSLEIKGNEIYDLSRNGFYGHVDGIKIMTTEEAKIHDNLIHDLTRVGSYGFVNGIMTEESSYSDIYNNRIWEIEMEGDNGYANGIYLLGSNHIATYNNLVYGMLRTGYYGNANGYYIDTSDDCTLANCTFFDIGKADYYGSANGVRVEAAMEFDVRNCIVEYVHVGGSYQFAYGVRVTGVSTVVWEYSDIYGVNGSSYNGISPGEGSIFADPDFADKLGDPPDFHLNPGSPCVNSGDPDPEYQDWNGTPNDMGCYGGPMGNW